MTFQSYTRCVQPQDYKDPLVSLPDALTSALGWDALKEALDFMLNGKLVCLGGDRCAIGQVISFETPADKSFPDSVDNDFSINLMLFPNTLDDFIDWKNLKPMSLDDAYQVAKQGIQGDLITEQPGMPRPLEALPLGKRYVPYPIKPLEFQTGSGKIAPTFYVPVLHLECEGSRINDLLKVLENVVDDVLGGTGICDIKIGPWKVGKAVCKFISNIIPSPAIALALAIAWANARDGNKEDPRTGTKDDQPGELGQGNMIAVTGRWAYDAGHQGWNELHPVKKIIKISEHFDNLTKFGDPKEVCDHFCTLMSEPPPPDRDGPGGMPSSMTPVQQETWDNQVQPENRWILHPAIDGCLPPDQYRRPNIR